MLVKGKCFVLMLEDTTHPTLRYRTLYKQNTMSQFHVHQYPYHELGEELSQWTDGSHNRVYYQFLSSCA